MHLRLAIVSLLAVIFLGIAGASRAADAADTTDTDPALADLTRKQKEADLRKSIAEAEKAEAAAKVPATDSKALAGTVNSEKFGAAGLVKAFDLAVQLAGEVCQSTKSLSPVAIYDATTIQGIVNARVIDASLTSMTKQVTDAKTSLESVVGTGVVTGPKIAPLLAIGVAVGAIKAAADLASMAKTNVAVVATDFGEGAKNLFVTSLAEQCPTQIVGLGTGYLGDLDLTNFDGLKVRFDKLTTVRNDFSDRIAVGKKLADDEKDPAKKKRLADIVDVSSTMLKTADAYIDSLKASDVSDKSPLYNAARHLGYAGRTAKANLLDFDLRLEGLTITKENIFTGQKLRLSGVAFLTYRVFSKDGSLLASVALRRITRPIEIDLRGSDPEGDFWNGPAKTVQK